MTNEEEIVRVLVQRGKAAVELWQELQMKDGAEDFWRFARDSCPVGNSNRGRLGSGPFSLSSTRVPGAEVSLGAYYRLLQGDRTSVRHRRCFGTRLLTATARLSTLGGS